MQDPPQRVDVRARWPKRRLPAALLAVLLTAPLHSACSSDLECNAGQPCGLASGSGLAGASGSALGMSGGGSVGTGSLGGSGGANVANQAGTLNANGGVSTAGAAMGGTAIGGTAMGGAAMGGAAMGGTAIGGFGNSEGGGGAGNAGAATGGKSSGGGGAGGSAGSGGSAGAGGKPGTGGTSGSGGSGSAGMSGSGGSGSVDPYAAARQTCVDRVNTLRATKGLGPIPRLPSAEACADGQAKKDSESGVAHSAFGDCVNQVQGWTGAAQNECPGYGSVASTLSSCIDQMWAEGPGGGHYDNMVGDSDFIACGFYTTPAGKVWMLQDFWSK